MHWNGKANGELLGLMTLAGFDAFVTMDRALPAQQNLDKFRVTIFILRGQNNKLDTLRELVPLVLAEIEKGVSMGVARDQEIVHMKNLTLMLLLFLFVGLPVTSTTAQDKIIVLVRHAEKAAAQSDMSADPELSAEGKLRAQRLVKKVGKYRPKEIYSTDFKRTRDTVAPLAAKRNVQIQVYDPRKAAELADKIMRSPSKRILVSGHSNTVPSLANLLGKKELFKNLDESEYTVMWVIRIKKGKLAKIELIPY